MKNQMLLWVLCIGCFIGCQSESNHADMKISKSAASTASAGANNYNMARDKSAPSKEMNGNVAKKDRPQETIAGNPMSKEAIPKNNRKIIKTGHYHLEVAEAEPSTIKIEALVGEYDGFISDMNWTKSNPWIQNSLKIRVPYNRFDELWAAIGKEGVDTRMKKITSSDVSEEYVDISSRLKTKQKVRDRYESILRNQAKSVEDVLMAEDKIRVLQEEIEAIEGRLRFLNDQVSWSTINLVLFQKMAIAQAEKAVVKNTFFTKASSGFWNGWGIITDSLLVMINIWPLALVLLGVLIWKRNWLELKWRRRKTV